jgi:glycosyltransferase involved in cell wall biosynthesis
MHLTPELIRFIVGVNPEIKIIFGIRNPVDRAWSHAKMNVAVRRDEFGHLAADDRIKVALQRHHIIDAGFYRKHLRKWAEILPAQQIFLFEYATLQRNPAKALEKVCNFLKVPISDAACQDITERVGRVAGTERWEMPARYRQMLNRTYRDEIEALKTEYQIEFPDPSQAVGTRPLILVPKDSLEYSETFISNHIRGLGGVALSVREFMPLVLHRNASLITHLKYQLTGRRRLQRAINRLNQQQAPILIEYGTTAAWMLPALRHCKVPVIIHFHGFDAYRKAVVEKHLEAYSELFGLASGLVVVSTDMYQKLIELGAPEEKIHHVACGVNPDLFEETDASQTPPVFFACGRFVAKKAPLLTIRAFYQAMQQHPDIRLRYAGDGPLHESARNLVSELDINGQVEFLGAISNRAVAGELQGTRAFVQHSVVASSGDSEGTPVGIMEAGCSAVPVISTRHGGIPDVVIDGKTGMLGAEHDVDSMARAIGLLASQPELAGRMGAAARSHILMHHTLEHAIQKLKGVLGDIQ